MLHPDANADCDYVRAIYVDSREIAQINSADSAHDVPCGESNPNGWDPNSSKERGRVNYHRGIPSVYDAVTSVYTKFTSPTKLSTGESITKGPGGC